MSETANSTPEKPQTPWSLRVSAAVLAVETMALVVAAVWLVSGIFSGNVSSLGSTLFLVALLLLGATWIGFAVRGLLQAQRWARSAAVFWQLAQLSIAFASFFGQFANYGVGLAIAVPSLGCLYLLFTKASIDATKDQM
jgi:hypothetical protein